MIVSPYFCILNYLYMKLINVVLIDVTNKTVTDVTIENKLEAYYEKIGCDLVEHVHIDRNIDMYVDEEGLFKDKPFFTIKSSTPLRGNGLIIGTDFETGETTSSKLKADQIRPFVRFL